MLLIFKSQTTRAVYSFNGKEVVTITGTSGRPVGKIMKGLDGKFLKQVFERTYTPPKNNYNHFQVGEACYHILSRIND